MELRAHLQKNLSDSFNYQSKAHLLESQDSLITLSKRIIKFIDQLSQDLQNSCYELLLEIVRRREFSLNCMGFDKLPESLKSKATSVKLKSSQEHLRHFKTQMLVAQKYERFLYNCLAMVLTKMADFSLSPQELKFVSAFLAISFFRIPGFRKNLMTLLPVSRNRVEIKNYDVGKASNSYFYSHFDWETEFYEILNEDKRSEENKENLKELLDKHFSSWEGKFSDHELIYIFTSEYFNYVQRTIHSKNMMPWPYVPGYAAVKTLFLSCIESHDFITLPQSLVDAITALLSDENLFKTVFNIVIFKIELKFELF